MIMPDWLFLIMVPLSALGFWVILGAVFHLSDWIHPNRVSKWARANLVDATYSPRFMKKEVVNGEKAP